MDIFVAKSLDISDLKQTFKTVLTCALSCHLLAKLRDYIKHLEIKALNTFPLCYSSFSTDISGCGPMFQTKTVPSVPSSLALGEVWSPQCHQNHRERKEAQVGHQCFLSVML